MLARHVLQIDEYFLAALVAAEPLQNVRAERVSFGRDPCRCVVGRHQTALAAWKLEGRRLQVAKLTEVAEVLILWRSIEA